MAETSKVRIAYTGEALENGAMDINYLAPALLAFADLVKRANVLVGNTQPVRLMLNADSIKRGSFDVTLELIYSGLDQIKLLMGAAEDIGLKALSDALGIGATIKEGVFWLIQAIGNKKILNVSETDDNKVAINLNDNSKIIINQNTYNVFMDHEARSSITKVMEPVKKDGIDGFEIRNPYNYEDKKPSFKMVKDDLQLYETPELETNVVPENIIEQEVLLKIVSLVFDEAQKWRFTDGDTTFWAKVEDKDFWNSVNSSEQAFRNGDRLKAVCRIVQRIGANGNIITERSIIKVIEVLPKPTQIKLKLE